MKFSERTSNSQPNSCNGAPRPDIPSYPTRYDETAEWVFANGYPSVPIRPGTKRPVEAGWTRFAGRQTRNDVEDLVRRYPDFGLGIITGETIGFDLDIADPQVVREIIAYAERRLGAGLGRVGRAPRTTLVYRTEKPFSKLPVRNYAKPGETQKHHIELQAHGQQFVAFHIHPDTGKAYRWIGGRSPLNMKLKDLPAVDETAAREFVREAEAVLVRHGYRSVGEVDPESRSRSNNKAVIDRLGGIPAWFGKYKPRVLYHDSVSINELERAVSNCPYAPLTEDSWYKKVMFPLADAIRKAPADKHRLLRVYRNLCERTADPGKWCDGYHEKK